MFDGLISFVRDYYATQDFVPLHAPVFQGNEQGYVSDTIQSTFVSSVGAYVDRFEQDMAKYTGAAGAVAVVNGTSGLHTALRLVGVEQGDLVLTQALTFVATCNAIDYCGARPVFIDVDIETLGLSAAALEEWLNENAIIDDQGVCRTKDTGQRVAACMPMHTFGHPADLDGLLRVADKWGIKLVEDAAESLGSRYGDSHTGTLGDIGVLSFNGNKIMTTGGGGMILASAELAAKAKHLTTTAKQPHPFEYVHDEVGFNYRMPNLNAALGCAQLEELDRFIEAKRDLAKAYQMQLRGSDLSFVDEPINCRSNFWLNAVICENLDTRNALLESTNAQGVMTRPVWKLMNHLEMYSACLRGDLKNSEWLADRVVNLPSSVPPSRALR